MKQMTLSLSLLLALSAQAVFAASPRFNNSQIFVKMNEGQKLSKSALITEVKPLFGDIYLVKTTDADKLVKALENDSAVKYTERDSYAGEQAMPTAKFGTPKSSLYVAGFNDPSVSRLWAFNSAEK